MRKLWLVLALVAACGAAAGGWWWLARDRAAEPSLFIAFGDTRTDHAAHARVVAAIRRERPQFILQVGDLVEHRNNRAEWDTFREIEGPLLDQVPYYAAIGNHEAGSRAFFAALTLPGNERWYAFTVDRVRTIVLDSNAPLVEGSEQRAWLRRELNSPAAQQAQFIVAMCHHPAFSSGPRRDQKRLRELLVPLLEQAGVELVFHGHDHFYEHLLVNHINYVITGGGGAPLYDRGRTSSGSRKFIKAHHYCRITRDGDVLVVTAVAPDGRVLDSFRVEPRPHRALPAEAPAAATAAGDPDEAAAEEGASAAEPTATALPASPAPASPAAVSQPRRSEPRPSAPQRSDARTGATRRGH